MDLRLALFLMAGAVLGECMRYVTRRLLQNRIKEVALNPVLASGWSHVLWMAAGAGMFGAICLYIPEQVSSIEIMGMLLILLSIAVIDKSIRKIPNELIAALFVLKAAAALISMNPGSLIPAAIGMAVGLVLFLVPSHFGMTIGWGDIKFAAVAGFCLGIAGILQASLIMSASLALYLLYLSLTKKGSWKTKVAIGPSLSLGIGLTLLFPLAIAIL